MLTAESKNVTNQNTFLQKNVVDSVKDAGYQWRSLEFATGGV